LDPFAGSNVTGEACEALGRHWIAIETVEEYLVGSRFRFDEFCVGAWEDASGKSCFVLREGESAYAGKETPQSALPTQ
jgi:hypothetical protein